MINLFKYDLKRNATTLLAATVILVMFELFAMFFIHDEITQLVLSFVACGFVALLFLIITLRSYDYNIKTLSRRLLPVHTLSYVWASLLFGLLCTIVLFIIGGLLGWYYLAKLNPSFLHEFLNISPMNIIALLAEGVWYNIYGLLIFFLSITLSRTFTKKENIWIGIAAFLIITTVTGWVESLLFNQENIQFFSMTTIHIETGNPETPRVITSVFNWDTLGMLVFELLLGALYLYVISKCIEKRVQSS